MCRGGGCMRRRRVPVSTGGAPRAASSTCHGGSAGRLNGDHATPSVIANPGRYALSIAGAAAQSVPSLWHAHRRGAAAPMGVPRRAQPAAGAARVAHVLQLPQARPANPRAGMTQRRCSALRRRPSLGAAWPCSCPSPCAHRPGPGQCVSESVVNGQLTRPDRAVLLVFSVLSGTKIQNAAQPWAQASFGTNTGKRTT